MLVGYTNKSFHLKVSSPVCLNLESCPIRWILYPMYYVWVLGLGSKYQSAPGNIGLTKRTHEIFSLCKNVKMKTWGGELGAYVGSGLSLK